MKAMASLTGQVTWHETPLRVPLFSTLSALKDVAVRVHVSLPFTSSFSRVKIIHLLRSTVTFSIMKFWKLSFYSEKYIFPVVILYRNIYFPISSQLRIKSTNQICYAYCVFSVILCENLWVIWGNFFHFFIPTIQTSFISFSQRYYVSTFPN